MDLTFKFPEETLVMTCLKSKIGFILKIVTLFNVVLLIRSVFDATVHGPNDARILDSG